MMKKEREMCIREEKRAREKGCIYENEKINEVKEKEERGDQLSPIV